MSELTMSDTLCSRCRSDLPVGASFCPRCGAPVMPLHEAGELKPRYSVFWLSILGSLLVTGILTLVLGWPVFILGAFLPLFWRPRR